MASLEQRLERLEASDGGGDVMAVSWQLDSEARSASVAGDTVARADVESCEAFVRRAARAASAAGIRFIWLE